MEEQQTKNIIIQDLDYIKLSISTKGVYTWDIKMIGHDIEKLKNINNEMQKQFPQGSQGLIIPKNK